MTRTSRDWRQGAQTRIEETVEDIERTLDGNRALIEEASEAMLAEAHREDPDYDAAEQATHELRGELLDAAHDLLDLAHEVQKFRSGSTLRNLEGKEPVGYSKRDGGAVHDAHYASNAQSAMLSHQLYWPLRLNEWESERAGGSRDGIEKVVAEGTEKFTKRVGDVPVAVVVDHSDYSPI